VGSQGHHDARPAGLTHTVKVVMNVLMASTVHDLLLRPLQLPTVRAATSESVSLSRSEYSTVSEFVSQLRLRPSGRGRGRNGMG
jgi:hypothetical protein